MKYQAEFLAPFLSEVVEARLFYFFKNWLIKLKCPILLEPLDIIIQENYQPFYKKLIAGEDTNTQENLLRISF